ncbi:protein-L-isoaspartate O-methyltransferase family protein [Xanthomonas hortorum]|uniref:Protein-L-isoaspartate O-methyltransferase n=1 Tax=Xanthomonas hortorum pv. pelargonii TaxID=453602 RepID=A0A6V7C5E4_9XANT|nr:protein-L-isoaspartate O-methyltransferase [Xanthomonas hortorum]MCE4354021.1 protein-L-isoaspartate O-methyltransferase [Xanthomonas hortorum pv. pelargonii]MCM5523158.1 protein-L-isoaspartate O-methyltransferase [Xanthomonas hortorum pv. pelargonii]MCM5534934.1 protein-L-isoaspartate O-methyltransferase [Xanthomonas hortorum pv. pelargonii]MCM5540271.1 protein-L-isoaspartate O-methyltransferase [Xanthomonas hortorum pv. pelargonii]MCM5543693.1 protein-L-isoaspartate O-methyltransferase [X
MTIDFSQAREKMVEQQIRPWDVLDLRVLDVLARLPREAFVPEAYKTLAYVDVEIPLSAGHKMMKPVVEGRMLQALDLQPGEDVLEIGTGSGFSTACLAALAREVVSLEIDPALATAARANLDSTGLGSNVRIETADVFAWQSERRFDAICITGAVDTLPTQWLQWLRPNGRLFVVRGHEPVMEAVLVRGDVNAPRIESLFETDLAYLQGAAPTPRFQF